MCRFRVIHFVATLLLAGLPLASPGAEPENPPAALGIFDAALVQFENSRVALRKWQYYQTLTTHQLDSAGKIVAKGTWKSIVRPGDPRPLEYIAKSLEGRLSFFEASTEEPDASAGNAQLSKPKTASKAEKNQAEAAVDAVRKYNLRDRYVWRRLADENVAGENAYVIAFKPKPRQNTTSREERFFGLLAGRLWVSRTDFTVLKAEAALQSPCSLFWFIARVTTFQLTYEIEPARGGNRLLRTSRATARKLWSAFRFIRSARVTGKPSTSTNHELRVAAPRRIHCRAGSPTSPGFRGHGR